MRLEIAERLQCPRAHAPTPLVVIAQRKDDRGILEGVAGCPVCRTEATITRAEIRFEGVASVDSVSSDADSSRATADAAARHHEATIDLDRLAALLGLAEPGGAVLLCGRYGAVAAALAAACEVLVVITEPWPITSGDVVRAIAGDAICFTDGTFRAMALDTGRPPSFVQAALRSAAAGARVVGPAALDRPADVKELARDEREWVGVMERTGPLVSLARSPGR